MKHSMLAIAGRATGQRVAGRAQAVCPSASRLFSCLASTFQAIHSTTISPLNGLYLPSIPHPKKPLTPLLTRSKSTLLDRRILHHARRIDYALRGLAKKYKQHYYSVDDCANFARWIGRYHPDPTWKAEWNAAVANWEAYRSGTYAEQGVLPPTEEDPELAQLMYSRDQLLSLQLSHAQSQLDHLIALISQLPAQRPLWFPLYPKLDEPTKSGEMRKLSKGMKRQRRWEEARIEQAKKEGTLWNPPEKRDTSAHPWNAPLASNVKKNPLDVLLKGQSLLPKQTQLHNRRIPVSEERYVPFPKELKRAAAEKAEEKRRQRMRLLKERLRENGDEVNGQRNDVQGKKMVVGGKPTSGGRSKAVKFGRGRR